ILQWNCCGARSKLPQLQAISKNYDIICIQESLLSPSSTFSLRGFYTLRADITKPGTRGICIVIRYNIVFSIIDLSDLRDDSVEMLAVEVSNDQRPTLPPSSGPSIIDLIIATANMAPLYEARAEEDIWGSDHFPITVRVGTSLILRQRYDYKIKLDQREWTARSMYNYTPLVSSYDSFMSHLPPDEKEAYSRLTNHLVDTAVMCRSSSTNATSLGTVPISNERATPPWWTDKCQEIIIKRREAVRIWQRAPTIENFHNFKKARAKYSKVLFREKRKGWNQNLSDYLTLKLRFQKSLNHTADPSKERQTMQEAIQKLCPSCFQDISTSLEKMKKDNNSGAIFEEIDSPITVRHLERAISTMKKKSAPGLDRINNNMLAHLPDEYKELLVNFFNRFLTEGSVPDEWKVSLVVSIPKAEGSRVMLDSHCIRFAPISLLSCILKLLEKIVYWKLLWLMESQSLLPQEQMGFRPSRSCNDNLVTFTNYACSIFVWHDNPSIFLKLERLQYKAIRMALGYRQSTPINVMLYEARELPLKLRFGLLPYGKRH
ncbi:RNA-directed DNA polymerase from mobile element jockey, partial [Trachymyrmex cornetzi]